MSSSLKTIIFGNYSYRWWVAISNLFKCNNIKITFRNINTIYNQLIHKNYKTDKCTQSGVYKPTCPEYNKAYVGQTRKERRSPIHWAQTGIQKQQSHFKICPTPCRTCKLLWHHTKHDANLSLKAHNLTEWNVTKSTLNFLLITI